MTDTTSDDRPSPTKRHTPRSGTREDDAPTDRAPNTPSDPEQTPDEDKAAPDPVAYSTAGNNADPYPLNPETHGTHPRIGTGEM